MNTPVTRRQLVVSAITLAFAAACPLASPVVISSPVWPAPPYELGRDWALIFAACLSLTALLTPFCGGVPNAACVVSVSVFIASVYFLLLVVSALVHLSPGGVDISIITALLLFAVMSFGEVRHPTPRAHVQVVLLFCVTSFLISAAVSIPYYFTRPSARDEAPANRSPTEATAEYLPNRHR